MSAKKFVFIPTKEKNPTSCFLIKFKYEHGDADLLTYNNFIIKECDPDILSEYLEHFKVVSKAISDNRSYSTPFPEDLIYDCDSRLKNWADGIYIPLVSDVIYNTGIDNYASIEIEDIYFFDEYGVEHVLENKFSYI